MQIMVADRAEVEAGLVVTAGTYAMISIRDPAERRVRIPRTYALQAVLELAFDDAEPAPRSPTPPDIRLMIPPDARRIAAFVLQHGRHVDALVIHCEQGMSRSPAVAAAIAAHLGLDTMPYDRDYQPNAHVRGLVLEALVTAQSVFDAG